MVLVLQQVEEQLQELDFALLQVAVEWLVQDFKSLLVVVVLQSLVLDLVQLQVEVVGLLVMDFKQLQVVVVGLLVMDFKQLQEDLELLAVDFRQLRVGLVLLAEDFEQQLVQQEQQV